RAATLPASSSERVRARYSAPSRRVAKVSGAVIRRPSGPVNRARQRPEGSLSSCPNSRRAERFEAVMAGALRGVCPTLSHESAVPACRPGVPGPVTLAVTRPFTVERVTGIEPALSAWEAEVLPLNYTRDVPLDRCGGP